MNELISTHNPPVAVPEVSAGRTLMQMKEKLNGIYDKLNRSDPKDLLPVIDEAKAYQANELASYQEMSKLPSAPADAVVAFCRKALIGYGTTPKDENLLNELISDLVMFVSDTQQNIFTLSAAYLMLKTQRTSTFMPVVAEVLEYMDKAQDMLGYIGELGNKLPKRIAKAEAEYQEYEWKMRDPEGYEAYRDARHSAYLERGREECARWARRRGAIDKTSEVSM